MRLFAVILVVVMLVGCGGQEVVQAPPKSEEETAADEAKKKAARVDAKASPFEGEHTDLADGDTATWNAGMAITISDIHIAANETRRLQEENVERDAKDSPTNNFHCGMLILWIFGSSMP